MILSEALAIPDYVRGDDLYTLGQYLSNEPYVVEGIWQKIEVKRMNVALVNGERV